MVIKTFTIKFVAKLLIFIAVVTLGLMEGQRDKTDVVGSFLNLLVRTYQK
jgi:hypothetical protein